MLVASGSSGTSYLDNHGAGHFAVRPGTPGPGSLSGIPGVAIGDVNGDGYADAVRANGSANSITVYHGSPAGPLAGSRVDYATFPGGYPTPDALAIADVNGNGRLDVVAVGRFPGEVSTFLNDGVGGLGTAIVSPISGPPATNWDPRAVAVADFNGDGKLHRRHAAGKRRHG